MVFGRFALPARANGNSGGESELLGNILNLFFLLVNRLPKIPTAQKAKAHASIGLERLKCLLGEGPSGH